MKSIIILLVLLLPLGCSSFDPGMNKVKVLSKGSDPADAFCSRFSLTDAQAADLISRSREVEIKEFHDSYEYLPCFVKGTLQKGSSECKFTIRAGGTVELSCNDNSGFLYVCDDCDDLLGGSE